MWQCLGRAQRVALSIACTVGWSVNGCITILTFQSCKCDNYCINWQKKIHTHNWFDVSSMVVEFPFHSDLKCPSSVCFDKPVYNMVSDVTYWLAYITVKYTNYRCPWVIIWSRMTFRYLSIYEWFTSASVSGVLHMHNDVLYWVNDTHCTSFFFKLCLLLVCMSIDTLMTILY